MRLRNRSPLAETVLAPERAAARPAEDVLHHLGMVHDGELSDAAQRAEEQEAVFEQDGAVDEAAQDLRRTDIVHQPDRPSLPVRRGTMPPVNNRLAKDLRDLLTALSGGGTVLRTPQCIVVTGVHTEREAPVVAASLAVTCAGSGYRVLLVDANLNSPSLHEMFGASNEFGLTTLLSSSDPPNHLPQSTSIPNLAIIAAGPHYSNHASLLARERVFHRLAPIAAAFDYIIVDGANVPPALVAKFSAGADNVVVGVKQHVSSMRDLSNMIEILRAEGVGNPSVLIIE